MTIPTHEPTRISDWAIQLDAEYMTHDEENDIAGRPTSIYVEASGDITHLCLDERHTITIETGKLLSALGEAITWDYTRGRT